MIRHDYAAKHDAYKRRRGARVRRLWTFLTYRDPRVGESHFETIAAGCAAALLIGALVLFAYVVGGG